MPPEQQHSYDEARGAHESANDESCKLKHLHRPFAVPPFPVSFGSPAILPLRYSSTFKMAMNASCGTSTLPMAFMRFLPAFCFSSSLRLRVMSPP